MLEKRKVLLVNSWQLVVVVPLQIASSKVDGITVVNMQASEEEVLEEMLELQTGTMPTS